MRNLIALVFLVGCTTYVGSDGFEPPDVDPTFDSARIDPVDAAFTGVGLGVEYERVNTGNGVLIVYGGYTARMSYSAGWATELVDQELGALGVGQIYAVKGPQDPGYDAKEIANTKLRAHLKTVDDGVSPIFVIAHSSGSYVAHELFQQMVRRGETSFLSRVRYADLDGGGSGLDDDIVDGMASIAFVYARDSVAGESHNAGAARFLGDAYSPKASAVRVSVDHTGCNTGASWCMHDVVVTHRPHNHSTFDLADDYTDFDGRPVTTEYFGSITD